MLTQKILRCNSPAGDPLDGAHVGWRGIADPSTVIPDCLLVANTGKVSELSRGQAVLTEVFVEEHDARTVTILGTGVNTLFADTGPRSGYLLPDMQYPNRLGELMKQHAGGPLTDPGVARLMLDHHGIKTTKQQINKLRRGQRKLTRKWAELLEPIVGRSWPEIMGWTGDLPPAHPDPMTTYKTTGVRISWTRNYRKILSVEEAARRFSMSIPRLISIEAGEVEMTIIELATISGKLLVSTDFLLRGVSEDLPHQMAEEWEKHIRNLQSEPPKSKG